MILLIFVSSASHDPSCTILYIFLNAWVFFFFLWSVMAQIGDDIPAAQQGGNTALLDPPRGAVFFLTGGADTAAFPGRRLHQTRPLSPAPPFSAPSNRNGLWLISSENKSSCWKMLCSSQMQLEIWNLGNRQEQGEARQLEAQPKPWGISTFKWQMEEESWGSKAEEVPSEGCKENHTALKP